MTGVQETGLLLLLLLLLYIEYLFIHAREEVDLGLRRFREIILARAPPMSGGDLTWPRPVLQWAPLGVQR